MENGIKKICEKVDEIGSIFELQERLIEYGVDTTGLHFSVGYLDTTPDSVGITYQDNGNILVYKSRIDGSHMDYYCGKDEKYAIKVAVQKLSEMGNRTVVRLDKKTDVCGKKAAIYSEEPCITIASCLSVLKAWRLPLCIVFVFAGVVFMCSLMSSPKGDSGVPDETAQQLEVQINNMEEPGVATADTDGSEAEPELGVEYMMEEKAEDGIEVANPKDGTLYWIVLDLLNE